MKVLLLSRYGRLGASSRLRFYQYLPGLAAEGIDVAVAPFFSDAYLETFYRGGGKSPAEALAGYGRRIALLPRLRRFDLIWVEGEILPWLPAWVETWMRRAGMPYVVDYDDALFHRYDRHANPLVRRLLGAKVDRVMRGARAVVAGSDYLAARAVAAGARRVEYLPTSIDLARYPEPRFESGDGFTVGWIGSRTTVQYLRPLYGVLAELAEAHGVRVALVGAGRPEHPGFEYRDWSEETEVAELRSFDVGIMPLSDTPWARGKCGYKLIQYMGCGKPVIASPVGANLRIVEPGVNGFLAATAAEWKAALLALLRDRSLRERMGSAGRVRVEREYCTGVNAPKLAAVLRSAAGMPPASPP
jgi:glycosyltransferase involved in cell wall biosynthesis